MTATGHLPVGAVLSRRIFSPPVPRTGSHRASRRTLDRGSVASPQLVFVSCRAVRGPGADLGRVVRGWARGRPNERHLLAEVDRADSELRRGTDPAAVQRLLFGLLAGAGDDELKRAADLGDDGRHRRDSDDVVQFLGRRPRGDTVVLVTDLPEACVRGSADRLDALVLGPDLPVDTQGRLTGEMVRPMIGAERGAAITRFAAGRDRAISACAGVGCCWADLELLRAVGTASVSGGHPALLTLAHTEGWSILTGTAAVEGHVLRQP